MDYTSLNPSGLGRLQHVNYGVSGDMNMSSAFNQIVTTQRLSVIPLQKRTIEENEETLSSTGMGGGHKAPHGHHHR